MRMILGGVLSGCLLLAGLGSFAAPAAAAVHKLAVLTPSGSAAPDEFAQSGGVVVAGVDVFTEPAGGAWASGGPTAALTTPAGESFVADGSATNGTAIVAGAQDAGGSTAEYVYSRPAGGWSGAVGPSATLVTSSGVSLQFPVISGRLIAATGLDGAIYLFQEPTGGWSGTVEDSARLVDPRRYLGPASIQGSVVHAVAEDSSGRYVAFREPTHGWAGSIKPSGAILTGIAGPPPSFGFGDGLIAGPAPSASGAQVFRIPPPSKVERPKAIAYLDDTNQQGYERVLLSSKLAVLSSASDSTPSSAAESEISVITKPRGGWSGTLRTGRPLAISEYFYGLAVNGSLVFAQTATGPITVYRVTGSAGRRLKPVKSSAAVGLGLRTGRPELSFRAISTTGIDRLRLRLPAGLWLAGDAKILRRSITVNGVHPGRRGEGSTTVTARGHLITISSPIGFADRPHVSIGRPALRESLALRRALTDQPGRRILTAFLTIRTYIGATQRTTVHFHIEK